jgi:hypothetical protein
MQVLCQEKLVATWKWFETWLESLPDDFEERETLYELIDDLFEHIDFQEKVISNLDSDLKRVGESFNTLKGEIKELKRHTKAKNNSGVQKPLLCTQEQVRYACGHSKDGEFIKCLEHEGRDDGCRETNIVYVDIKTSTHSCRACVRKKRQREMLQIR